MSDWPGARFHYRQSAAGPLAAPRIRRSHARRCYPLGPNSTPSDDAPEFNHANRRGTGLRNHRPVTESGRPCDRNCGHPATRRGSRRPFPEFDECRPTHPVRCRCAHRHHERHDRGGTTRVRSHEGSGRVRRQACGRGPQRRFRQALLAVGTRVARHVGRPCVCVHDAGGETDLPGRPESPPVEPGRDAAAAAIGPCAPCDGRCRDGWASVVPVAAGYFPDLWAGSDRSRADVAG